MAIVNFVETFLACPLARLHGVTTYKIVVSLCVILLKNSEGRKILKRHWH
jgi:hypothetical protein